MADISKRGLELIKDYESFSSKAYLCPEKVPTIGWGSIRWSASRPVKLGETCTVAQAEDLLKKEVILVEDAIDSSVKVALTQGQFDCLCSWGYNVGTGWISGKGHQQATLIKLLNKGQYDKVPSELLKFKKGAKSGKSYDGLVNRRKRELRELWFSDHDGAAPSSAAPPMLPVERSRDDDEAAMPQSVGPTTGTLTEASRSPTVLSGLTGLLSSIGLAFSWVSGVAVDTSSQVTTTRQGLSGLEALWDKVGLSTAGLLLAVVAGSFAVVIVRHVNRYLEGRA